METATATAAQTKKPRNSRAITRTSATFHVYKMAASGSLSSIGTADSYEDTRTLEKSSAAGGIYYVKVYDDGAAHTDKDDYTLELR